MAIAVSDSCRLFACCTDRRPMVELGPFHPCRSSARRAYVTCKPWHSHEQTIDAPRGTHGTLRYRPSGYRNANVPFPLTSPDVDGAGHHCGGNLAGRTDARERGCGCPRFRAPRLTSDSRNTVWACARTDVCSAPVAGSLRKRPRFPGGTSRTLLQRSHDASAVRHESCPGLCPPPLHERGAGRKPALATLASRHGLLVSRA